MRGEGRCGFNIDGGRGKMVTESVAAVTEWSRAALNSANRQWRKGANTEILLSSGYTTVVDSPITLPSKQQTKGRGGRVCGK